jgi:putative transposase
VFGIQPVRGALRRVDEAFAGFFRRLETGEKPGFPRFKSRGRFRTVSWDEPVSWKLDFESRRLYIQGVGHITLSKSALRQLHRLADRGGQARTLTVTRKRAGRHGWTWKATITFTNVAARKMPAPNKLAGVDRGVAVTAAVSDGQLLTMPPFLAQARDQIAELCRARDGCRKRSRRWTQLNRKIARVYAKAARRSDNWAREQAKAIVADHGVIALEQLKLKNMTRSARGTKEHPGKNVAAKQALNRSLQDAALGRLAYRICVKAEEAGRRVWLVDPKHTSTSCADCGHTEPANRKTRDRMRLGGPRRHQRLGRHRHPGTDRRGRLAGQRCAPADPTQTPTATTRQPIAARTHTLTGTRGRAGSGAARRNARLNP